jgi:rhomboid protease GluP
VTPPKPEPNTEIYDGSDTSLRPRGDRDITIPGTTMAIVLILFLIFGMEINQAFDFDGPLSPSPQALIALGGIDGHLVFGAGEWWRIFTGPMLHVGLAHIVGNCVALGLIGWCLEPLLGPGWFAAIFAIAAVGGSAGSLAQNDPHLVSVGASGAISGLLAAALITSFRIDDDARRRRMQIIAARILIPAVMPAFFSASANHGHVDYGAHLGGAMAGTIVALFLTATWNTSTRRPSLRPLAVAIACGFAVLTAAGFALARGRAPVYAAETPRFVPQSQFPHDSSEAMRQSADWIARYPEDPRGYFYNGLDFLNRHDAPGAAQQLRRALALYSENQASFSPAFGESVRMALALAIKSEGDLEAAREMAGQSCAAGDAPQNLRQILIEQKICP